MHSIISPSAARAQTGFSRLRGRSGGIAGLSIVAGLASAVRAIRPGEAFSAVYVPAERDLKVERKNR